MAMDKIKNMFRGIHSKINWNTFVFKATKLGEFSNNMVSKYHFFRKVTLMAVLVLVCWTTFQMFIDITAITAAATSAYGIVTGLLTVAIGFFFHSRDDDPTADDK